MDVLRQSTELSRSMQQEYFRAFVWPEKRSLSPRQILFSILQDDDLIGYGGLTNISWVDKRAEVSFLLAPSLERDASQKGRVFSSFLVFLRNLSFRELELQRIFCETFSHRLQHVQILEDVGFLKEGVLRGHAVVGGERVDSLIHGSLYEDWRT